MVRPDEGTQGVTGRALLAEHPDAPLGTQQGGFPCKRFEISRVERVVNLNPTKVVKYELKRQRKRVMSMVAWLRAPSGSPVWLFHEWALPPRSTDMVFTRAPSLK